MQPSVARKREWREASAPTDAMVPYRMAREEGDVIEKEMKRLRLAQEGGDGYDHHHSEEEDVDMDADGLTEWKLFAGSSSPRHDYRPINSTLRECHYLRQLRRFQAERMSFLERRASTDSTAAAIMHAMQGRRRILVHCNFHPMTTSTIDRRNHGAAS